MAGLANTSTAEIQARDARHHWHPFSDMAALNAAGSRVVTAAEGWTLTDSEGHQVLDGMSGLWNVAVGYGRREIVDAVAEALTTLSYTNTFFQCTHPAAAAYAEAIAGLLPGHLNRIFFTSSGSEANDTAFRAARTYWDLKGKPEKKRFIARRNGYHGSTVLGASLGGMAPMHGQSGLPIEGISHIDQPYWFGDGRLLGMSPAEYGHFAAERLAVEIDRLGADTVAAFIGEPIQGAGGVVIPPDTYWPRIAEICAERDILLVADEVICGFGRTGAMWGFETFGFSPDIVTMAKAMTSGYIPCGGVAFSDEVAATLETGGEFFHGYTASGHPAACAAGLANLAIIDRERLVERVATDIGPYLAARWASLGDHPLVGETRMRGLIGAFELVRDKAALERFPADIAAGTRCRDLSVRNGLVMRAVGDTMVIAPPLVISHEAADLIVARARKTLDDLHAALTGA
ncbi:aspartate aminotransferase family protein [Acuticoccus sediminis]|uniref:Aspartate aminotransferase family protein n=1 Tax=Acuticoccus sediminis TaxID=2184697 RepID=A0A8B2NK04_9HYPH|nr:aminotransferase [Acuticoccus sediminis]RAH97691.1 aspartate aminotransferase family protein [Acuticoccus sediminis]